MVQLVHQKFISFHTKTSKFFFCNFTAVWTTAGLPFVQNVEISDIEIRNYHRESNFYATKNESTPGKSILLSDIPQQFEFLIDYPEYGSWILSCKLAELFTVREQRTDWRSYLDCLHIYNPNQRDF